jgi:hypothetical protein
LASSVGGVALRERRGAAEGGDAERVVALSELVLGMFLIGGVV